jgi:hypothetical protein
VNGDARTSREWLAASAHHRHPDVVPQIVIAFDSPRSGDLVVFAAPSWDFSEKYLGGHGGLEAEELRIPLYFAGPLVQPGTEIPAARLVDVVPTLLELMSACAVDPALESTPMDGISLAAELAPRP